MRLEVPASQVGLEGSILNGMNFSVYGGRVTWDCAGKTSPIANHQLNVSNITNSVPSSISRVSGGNMQLKWPNVVGKIYRVAYKNDLTDATWTDLSGDITASGTPCSWTDSTAASANKRFYVVYVTN